MKDEFIQFIRVFIYANIIIGWLFFWVHAPQIFGLK